MFCPRSDVARRAEHDFRFGVEVGEIPIRIYGEETVAGFLQNIGHPPRRFLEGDSGMIPFLESLNVAFRNRKPHVQTAGVERFGEIIIRAGGERLFEILGDLTARSRAEYKFRRHSGVLAGRGKARPRSCPATSSRESETGKFLPWRAPLPPPPRWRRRPLRVRVARSDDADCVDYRGGPQSKEFSWPSEKLSPFHRPLGATVTAPENGRMARLQAPLEQDDCQSMGTFR